MPSRTARQLLLTIAASLALAASLPSSAYGDDTPPGPPPSIFVTEGENWQGEADFHVWWHNPSGQETQIAAAHYELCPVVPEGSCISGFVEGDDIFEMDIVAPYRGWFWLSVWLQDGAGNFDPNAKSQAVPLRFDDEAPPAPLLRHDGGWLNATSPTNPTFTIELPDGAPVPVSKIEGYSLTIDGSLPDAVTEADAAQDGDTFPAGHSLPGLPEGVTDVRLRTVSKAGIASEVATSAQIRVDRTPPVVTAHGAPDPDVWQREPVVVELDGGDQPGLSGMAPAPIDRPAEEGAHIVHRLDGGPPERIRGSEGQVEVAADGEHTLDYRAYDTAGNPSPEGAAAFKIDRTPPEGAFEAPSPSDPQRVAVRVLDATSGVAGGRIEYRREGDAAFTALPTELAGGRLLARLDDSAVPAGRYELRAVVADAAGNEAAIGHSAEGAAMTLALPLRAPARVDVTARVVERRCTTGRRRAAKRRVKRRVKRRAKRVATSATRAERRREGRSAGAPVARAAAKRRRAARRQRRPRRRCVAKRRTVPAGAPVALAHGKRMRALGHVSTAAGRPLARVRVTVEAQPRSGGAFERLGTATTDARGNFRLPIAAGPSRTIRFAFEGSGTVGAAMAQLVTEVAARARLKVDRRRLRNGQAVRFAGRLVGRPVPAAGKVVALQAKVGRRWRTFATPRANAKGVFRHRYRFTSTTGLRRYAFRAVVTREAAYPYERGVSRIVRVLVRGR